MEGKEYLWHLLNKAISTPKADVVNFKALRTLLEASIGHVDESQLSSLAKIREKQQKIHDDLKHLGDEKLVVSVGLPEEGICDSTDPVALQLSKTTSGRSVHNAPSSIQRKDNKIHAGKSSGSKINSPTAEKHVTHSNSSMLGSASSLNLTTSKLGKSSGNQLASQSTESRVSNKDKTFVRSASSLSLTTSKSPRSKTESDDKIEKKGIFSHRSNIQGTSREAIGTLKDNELTMVVSLPRGLVCESKDATEIKLSITDTDSIVTKVSVGGGRKKGREEMYSDSDDEKQESIKRSKSNVSDKGSVKSDISEKPHISEKWSAVNIDRHEKCGQDTHDVKTCEVTQSKSKEAVDLLESATEAGEMESTDKSKENHGTRPGRAVHKSVRDIMTDSSAFATTSDSSGTATPSGTAIDRKASKESVRSRAPDKGKKEIRSSKRGTSVQSSLRSSPRGRGETRDRSKDSRRPKVKSVSKDRQGMSSPLSGVQLSSMSESESEKVMHTSRDTSDLRKGIFNRHRTKTEDQSSDDQSPRSKMKRPQIISKLKDSKTKHLPSIGEYFPDKAKRMDYMISKLQKYKKEPPQSYKRCECNALRNANICNCDPKICLNQISCRNPRVCFCANSYEKGYDGVAYHTKCNCFDNLRKK